jgi:predicted metal-dependent peptidase
MSAGTIELSYLRTCSKLHPKIQEELVQFATSTNKKLRHPFYSNFLSFINIWETREIKTAGVNVSMSGLNLYYNPDWFETLKPENIRFILVHEIYHLLFSHHSRTIEHGFEHELSNIVQDWIINELISKHHSNKLFSPPVDEHGRNIGVFLPKEYDGPLIYEAVYVWAKEKRDELLKNIKIKSIQNDNQSQTADNNVQNQDNKNEESKNGEQQIGCIKTRGYGEHGKSFDTWSVEDQLLGNALQKAFDQHIEDEISKELSDEKRDMVIEKIKSRGVERGDMEEILQKLNPPPSENPLKRLRSIISESSSKKYSYKTYQKMSRREEEGLKGKKRSGGIINVLLDTSGSMSGQFEHVLSYLINAGSDIKLIQCDTAIESEIIMIKSKRDIEKIKIKGLGGTVLQPGIDFFVNNGLNRHPLVILTDGYTDKLDLSKFQTSMILYTDVPCPTYDTVEQVHIKNKKY